MDKKLIKVYKDGIDAAYRIGKYEKYTDIPVNPYLKDSYEADVWFDGFSDGTDDLVISSY